MKSKKLCMKKKGVRKERRVYSVCNEEEIKDDPPLVDPSECEEKLKIRRESPKENLVQTSEKKTEAKQPFLSVENEEFIEILPAENLKAKYEFLENCFSSLIWTLVDCLNRPKANSHPYQESLLYLIENSKLVLASQSNLELSLNKLQRNLQCFYCLLNKAEIQPSCFDEFCKNCYKNIISERTNQFFCLSEEELEILEPRCPICRSLFTHEDLKIAAGENYEQLEEQKRKRNLREKCRQCFQFKKLNEFPENDFCNHMCFECTLHNFERNKFECVDCEVNRRSGFLYRSIVCCGCKKGVNLIESFVSRCCEEHFMCIDCLFESYCAGNCKFCGVFLEKEELERIFEVVFRECSECKSVLKSIFFSYKNCCEVPVCEICEYEFSETFCRSCETRLKRDFSNQFEYLESQLETLKSKFPDFQ